ncbi:hypothetical protein O3M35_012677 [Rhynocoris fuscipes]|uniref:Uncharacterized protein n=1 Tax=Rhynocoris fuscipes TaxID=488301 RepID=A0AAW1D0I8_9HEMI
MDGLNTGGGSGHQLQYYHFFCPSRGEEEEEEEEDDEELGDSACHSAGIVPEIAALNARVRVNDQKSKRLQTIQPPMLFFQLHSC